MDIDFYYSIGMINQRKHLLLLRIAWRFLSFMKTC